MKEIELPSGNKVLNPLSETNPVSESSDAGIESTSGTLSLDLPNQCPKCKKQMIEAKANGEPVYWCATCRVTAPMTIS